MKRLYTYDDRNDDRFDEAFQKEVQESRATYGLHEVDTWNLHGYLGWVIANGLEELIDNAHGWPGGDQYPTPEDWEAEVRLIIDKIRFASDDSLLDILHDHIDFSNDAEFMTVDDTGLCHFAPDEEVPGYREYFQKGDVIEDVQRQFMEEALEWLKVRWFWLWD